MRARYAVGSVSIVLLCTTPVCRQLVQASHRSVILQSGRSPSLPWPSCRLHENDVIPMCVRLRGFFLITHLTRCVAHVGSCRTKSGCLPRASIAQCPLGTTDPSNDAEVNGNSINHP